MEKEKREQLELYLEENYEYAKGLDKYYGLFASMADYYLTVFEDLLIQDTIDIDDIETLDDLNVLKKEDYIKYEKIDFLECIALVKEFLYSVDVKYVELFDKARVDGTFDFFLPEDDLYERPDYALTTPKPNASIYVPVEHTTLDALVIIHELFHYINDTEELVGTREIYTEMISMYYELRFAMFLEEKGYKNTYYKQIYDRLDATFDSANNLCYTAGVFDIYHSLGDITEEKIEFISKFRPFYKENMDSILDFIDEDEFEENISKLRDDIGYVLGTLIIFKALEDPTISDIKMKYLNDNINTFSLDYVLEVMNININDYMELIENCAKYLNLAMEKIDEENYSNSGPNRSR